MTLFWWTYRQYLPSICQMKT